MSGKRRALVLGGGGPVGVGWETGLAAGLAAAGVDLARADTVLGTSAGSITGAYLAGGADASRLADEVADLFTRSVDGTGVDRIPTAGLAAVMDLLIGAVADTNDSTPPERLARVGRIALEAETISEDAFVGAMARELGDRPWPAGFSCTAIDTATGELVVWNERSSVPLERAVASSCSVPGIYPPVTIDGARYMDGGARSPLNADLVVGHDVVVVVSVMPLELPPGFEDERFQRFFDAQHDEIEGLRTAGAQVEVIAPDEEFLGVSGYGMSLMDFGLVTAAVDAGLRLGKAEADRIATIW